MKKFISYASIVAVMTTIVFYATNECYMATLAYAMVTSTLVYRFRDIIEEED